MRARKPSSTSLSFLTGEGSLAGCLGGGPRLGRGRPRAEFRPLIPFVAVNLLFCGVPAAATLVLLGERPTPSAGRAVLLTRARDWRGELTLEPDEAVCVVRLAGSLTGRVGDLDLGLAAPPVVAGDDWPGVGFFVDELTAGLDWADDARDGTGFSAAGSSFLSAFFFAARLEADVRAGCRWALSAVGDFCGFGAGFPANEAPRGFGAGFVVRILGLVASFRAGFCQSFSLSVPPSRSSFRWRDSPLSGAASLSLAVSDPGAREPGSGAAGVLESAPWDFSAGADVALHSVSDRGDSKMACVWRNVFVGDFVIDSNGFGLSVRVVGVVTPLSPLGFRSTEAES